MSGYSISRKNFNQERFYQVNSSSFEVKVSEKYQTPAGEIINIFSLLYSTLGKLMKTK